MSLDYYNLSEMAKNAGITLQEARVAVALKNDIAPRVLAEDDPLISSSSVGEASKAIAEYVTEKDSLRKEVGRLQARNAELEALVDKLMKR